MDNNLRERVRNLLGYHGTQSSLLLPQHQLAAYLYQVADLGTPLNRGLRKGRTTGALHLIYEEITRALDSSPPLEKEVTVYRGIPKEDIPALKEGDVFSDRALNSVSFSPKVARSFGSSLFAIRMKRGDRLVYLDHPEVKFYEDTCEAILPAGMKYKVERVDGDVYEVTTQGRQEENEIYVDHAFDVEFLRAVDRIKAILGGNAERGFTEQRAVYFHYRNREDDFIRRLDEISLRLPLPSPPLYSYAPLYTEFLREIPEIRATTMGELLGPEGPFGGLGVVLERPNSPEVSIAFRSDASIRPEGNTAMLALTPCPGYNQEDPFVFNGPP